MPDWRHLWRGIHDGDAVRRAIAVVTNPPALVQGRLIATLRIRNIGAGHDLPTYVTPRIVVEIYQEDSDRRALDGTLAQLVIQRRVALDPSHEIADTRLAPGDVASLDYRRPLLSAAARLVYRVRVEPGAFYTAFYESLLPNGGAGRSFGMIRDPLGRSRASQFFVYNGHRDLRRK